MRHLKRSLGFVALAGGVAFAMPAGATQWLTSSATGTTAQYTMTDSIGGTVKVRAYSTKTAGTDPSTCSTTCPASTSGYFQAANLYKYTGGFGISNTVTGDLSEGTQPEHAVDNNQIFDLLVFELPSTGFDIEAFRLGWATESWGSTVTNEADIQAYFGGNSLGANYNFASACFTGCTNALQDATKFTNLNSLITVGTGGGNDVPSGTSVTIGGTQSGQYLVLTGALGGTNDAFKVDMIKGSGGMVPTPGTLALVGLGLFGLVTLRRRPAFA